MTEKVERPNYYAIIPASVRYDNNLPGKSSLLYGEITALCNQKGYCWASDSYFADLYGVAKSTIQTWLKALEINGHISRDVIYKEGTREIEHRYIRISVGVYRKTRVPLHRKTRERIIQVLILQLIIQVIKNIVRLTPHRLCNLKKILKKFGKPTQIKKARDKLSITTRLGGKNQLITRMNICLTS